MRIYLSASWSRQEELQVVAATLRAYDHKITARWLDETAAPPYSEKFLRSRAFMDWDDVCASNLLVRFTDDLTTAQVPASLATGGRMVEMGIALERGIPILVVGGPQPIFDHLPHIIHLRDTAALYRFLAPYEIN